MNKSKLENLEQEFPFLKSFLEKNFGLALKDKRTTLNIKVQRIDPEILFYFGDHMDGHRCRFIKEKQYGSLFTSFFFINNAGEPIYFRFGPLHDWVLNDLLIVNKKFQANTKTIVKAETETWYDIEKNDEGEAIPVFKHFSSRQIHMTIYKEPEAGLLSLVNDPNLVTKVRLYTRLLIRLICSRNKNYKIVESKLEEIKNQFKSFFEEHLQAEMYKERAFNCQVGDIKFLSLSMAGRLLITLDTPTTQISYMAVDEEKCDSRMGVNSIEATLEEAKTITESFISSCTKRFNGGEKFSDIFKTGEVGFAGHAFGKKAEQSA
ncbi:MAG: hypothetical protein WC875_04345 [Candidatus Absconditabacterales bacterium]